MTTRTPKDEARGSSPEAGPPGSDHQGERDREEQRDLQAHQRGQADVLEVVAPLDPQEWDKHGPAEKSDAVKRRKNMIDILPDSGKHAQRLDLDDRG
ncbi:hypothetical protein [Streptosporangium saharense]|uniref:hypothetical protein n=1 Tax=Streptosporangium saharense TaxID=1706840 RepID=UPI003413ED4D